MTDAVARMRQEARRLYNAAVAAADPAGAVSRALKAEPLPRPDTGGRTIVIAIGKAAPAMLGAALANIDGPATALAVTHHENSAEVAGARVLRAGHPVPDAAGQAAGAEVLRMLDAAGPADRVVALISGGGSALVPAPSPGLSLSDKQAVNRALLASGLDIVAMNEVRQQLSELKGGGFLRRAAPATVTALILSDVIGDDLRAIASGPTVAPLGTRDSAARLLRDCGAWDKLPEAVRAHLSQPQADAPLPPVTNRLIGSNGQSVAAMQAASPSAVIADDALTGDVADAAEKILHAAETTDRPATLLFGGETTVRLTGNGLGGRNQELALRIALGAKGRLSGGWAFLSGGTDGRDGPTEAAGGLVDGGSAARMRAAGADPVALLANNDSHAALAASGDLLMTGATGTNVADVQVLILG